MPVSGKVRKKGKARIGFGSGMGILFLDGKLDRMVRAGSIALPFCADEICSVKSRLQPLCRSFAVIFCSTNREGNG